jgi:hypothetical protein
MRVEDATFNVVNYSQRIGVNSLRFSAPNAQMRFANESLDRNVSKLVSEIKVPSNVVSDTALHDLVAKLQTGVALRSCRPLGV